MAPPLIAFYLPQFHPIPENDEWWGKGFTEWRNVARATPLFKGHYQPHLPADLGFYDLRLAEARSAQAELASSFGLHGFCYYHYWFAGKRLLDRPFDSVRESGTPAFPFCLCWANETWSRRWLGEETAVLMRQVYSAEDDLAHAAWLGRAFGDQRYIRIDGRPLFLIYRPHDLPNPHGTIDAIKNAAVALGVGEPYIVGVDAHRPGVDFRESGFDATLAFEPQLGALPGAFGDGFKFARLRRNVELGIFNGVTKLYRDAAARAAMMRRHRSFPFIRSVYVGWDNTPRRGKDAIVVVDSSPDAFEQALSEAVAEHPQTSLPEHPIFINAWNEWAEGNHLEPDQRFGLEYLQRVRKVAGSA
jgi:hypothetical protein